MFEKNTHCSDSFTLLLVNSEACQLVTQVYVGHDCNVWLINVRCDYSARKFLANAPRISYFRINSSKIDLISEFQTVNNPG